MLPNTEPLETVPGDPTPAATESSGTSPVGGPPRADSFLGAIEPGGELRRALDTKLRDNLLPIAAWLAALFGFLAVANLANLAPPLAERMSSMAAATATAIVLLTLVLYLRRTAVPPRLAHPLATAVALLVMFNAALHLYLTGAPEQTTNLMLLVLGAGCAFLSLRWLSVVILSTWSLWAAIVWDAVSTDPTGAGAWTHFAIGLLGAGGAAAAIAVMRVRSLTRVEQVGLARVRQAEELALALEAVQRSEERYRSVVDTADDMIATSTLDGVLESLNPAFERVTGWSREQWIGRPFAPLLQEDDVPTAMHVLQEIAAGRQVGAAEYRVRTRDGRFVLVEVRTRAIARADGVVSVLAIARDITEQRRIEEELRQSEARWRSLVEHAPDAIALVRRDGHIQYVNRVPAALGAPEALIGRSVLELSPPERRDAVAETLEAVFERGETRLMPATPLTQPDGSTRWHQSRYGPILGDGKVVAAIVISTDVTTQKAGEEALREARDVALNSNRIKSEFLANMSHEIRTPLNAIVGMSGLLLDTELTEDQRGYVETMRTSGRALVTIVNDILDFSKIEAGKLTFEVADFDLRDLIENVTGLLGEEARAKRIDLESEIDADVPVRLRGDAGRISQALINLVSNAVKFTRRGHVRVRVSADSESPDQATIRVAVTDTGIGIAAEDQQRLFRAFSQGDGSTSRRYGGTGLGLAISKQLVELMYGAIGMLSVAGEGSTFWFTLPLAKQPPDDVVPEEVPAPALRARHLLEGGGRSMPAGRILIAEDNAANRTVLVRQLQKLGYAADAVSSGVEALAATVLVPYDLILMDCQMPEMDGYETTAEIRRREARGHRTPIIAVTAHATDADRQRCLAASMDDFIRKPVDEDTLARVLAQWLSETPPHGHGDPIDQPAAGDA